MANDQKPTDDQKPVDELTEEQLEAVAGGIALAGAVGEQGVLDVTAATVDKSSPVLLKACATGEHIKEVTITMR